jgi:hypothetical protein
MVLRSGTWTGRTRGSLGVVSGERGGKVDPGCAPVRGMEGPAAEDDG